MDFSDILGAGRRSWSPVIIFDKGHISIERPEDHLAVRYDLRSLHGLLFCLCGAAVFGLIDRSFSLGLFVFAWLYGGNLIIAFFLALRFFKRTALGVAG